MAERNCNGGPYTKAKDKRESTHEGNQAGSSVSVGHAWPPPPALQQQALLVGRCC